MQLSISAIIIISILFLFIIYRRFRRNTGWQKMNQRKLLARAIIFLIVGLWLLKLGISHPINLISDILGILIGASLAYYGFRKTTFEKRQEDWYFRPNIWIGSAVTLLFFMRLIYRIYYLATLEDLSKLQEQANGMQNIEYAVGNSWGAGLILIMFAYYATYYLIIVLKDSKLSK